MTATLTRKKLHTFVDELPDDSLSAVEAALTGFFAEPDYVVETDLTAEEIAIIEEGDREFAEHPENFISLDDYLKTRGIDKQALMGQGRE
jgi:hypothetical protein